MKDELTRLSEHIGLEPSRFLKEESQPDSQATADSAAITKLSARLDGVETAFREYIKDSELESQLIANREEINRLSADMETLKKAQKGDSSMVRTQLPPSFVFCLVDSASYSALAQCWWHPVAPDWLSLHRRSALCERYRN